MWKTIVFLACLASDAAVPVRVLIVSGAGDHGWRETTPYLRRILESANRFDVRVTEEPAGLTPDALTNYDVVVVNGDRKGWGQSSAAVEGFLRSGKGLIAVHTSGGMLKTAQGKRHVMEGIWVDLSHPIASGLDASFRFSDELHEPIAMQPGAHVLATAKDNSGSPGTERAMPILWVDTVGKGRAVSTALGHDVTAMTAPGFAVSFARATEWAATGEVTLGRAIDLHAKRPDAIRVLLVTGGHDHEASFYSVLEGRPDLHVNVDPHPVAFRSDLRKRYDVVVTYDMAPDLPEPQRKNLQEFAESLKGIVVLHHSIVGYPEWPWWTELVGGRYRTREENGQPPSTYLHDVWQRVWPVADHPVVRGIPEIWLLDETYGKMWISPESRVLLRTDATTSDGPVAWVSPYSKSRVIYIQLGHGRDAHENPVYRDLVHNAILWTAGAGETH
jgi:type 1 glutamine amidotransferase